MLNSRKIAIISACLSAAGLLPMNGKANISFLKNEDELINTLHTHLYPQSDSLSSSQKIKTAAVCFINDTSNCADNNFGNNENINTNGSTPNYNLDDAERCRNEGYKLNSCAPGETPEGFCIYNSNYFEKCTCPAGYKTCELPYYGVGTACGNKYASCKEDTERACKELNSEFTNTCQSGWKIDPNNTCEYDSTYGKCCNLCNGYDYTTIPNGYIQNGEACTDCNGVKKYKIKINPCDGYQDCGSMGPDTGAKSCMSGTQIKYNNCKPCPNLGTLSSCPSPYTCTYEACSNRYYKSGCQSGYDWNASSKTCTAQCASSYRYTCSGTGYAGGVGTACNGKYTSCSCSSPYTWNGYSCTVNCGYKKMWNGSSCVCDPYYYPYSCNGSHESPTGTSCNGKYERCYCSGDYAWDGNKCVISCSSGYIWNGSQCVCDTENFIYPCTRPYEVGYGASCDGKYETCECTGGYSWNFAEGCYCRNDCNLDSCPEHANCNYEECSNKYCFSRCDANYEYDENTQTCNYICKYGSIYNSDGTCSETPESGKTPIGKIIFRYDSYGSPYFIILALEPAANTQWGPVGYNSSNCGGTCSTNNEVSASGHGLTCTRCYAADNLPSGLAANNYAPSGASQTKGHWYLPGADTCEEIPYNITTWTAVGYGGDYDKAWICEGGSLEVKPRTNNYNIYPVLYIEIPQDCTTYCPIQKYIDYTLWG